MSEYHATHYLIVSTEDDIHYVKGGIGTYLGILVTEIHKQRPNIKIVWVSETSGANDFVEHYGAVKRIFLSRGDLEFMQFVDRISEALEIELETIVATYSLARVIIEAPEWEGLLSDTFTKLNHPNILKVSRIHSSLAYCAAINKLDISQTEISQITRENIQLEHSDILSAPTNYIINQVTKFAFPTLYRPVQLVIPNCINVTHFMVQNTKRLSCKFFEKLTNLAIEDENFNIFILGSIEIRKGIKIIKTIIPKVLESMPKANFYFVGHYLQENGVILTANRKLTKHEILEGLTYQQRQRVHLAGYIEHACLPEVMAAGDLFVIAYLGDNFPGTVAEIGISTRPMVALMRGGIPEMICRNGETLALAVEGQLTCETEIASRMHTEILAHAHNPTKGMTLAAMLHTHMKQSFSPNKIVREMLTKYEWHLNRKIGA